MKTTKYFSLLFCFTLLLLNMQCDDEDIVISACDEFVLVDNSAYQNAETAFYSLVNFEVIDDCFNVTISSSGCGGETWVLTLIDSGDVMESLPPQRSLKLTLLNDEACLAVFNKEQSFDLAPLRVEDTNEVILNIEGIPEPIHYNY